MNWLDFIEKEKTLKGWKGTGYGESWYLYGLIRALKPQVVVEIGVFNGRTSVWIAKALQDNDRGELYCIDKNNLDIAKKNAEEMGVVDRIKFVVSDSAEYANKWPHKQCIDLLFIDGNHSIIGVSEDFTAWFKWMRENSFVVAHDAFASHPAYAVNGFFQWISRVLPTQWIYTGEMGLAVTQLDRQPPVV